MDAGLGRVHKTAALAPINQITPRIGLDREVSHSTGEKRVPLKRIFNRRRVDVVGLSWSS